MVLRIIDVSSYQPYINIGKTDSDGTIIKTTQGNWYSNAFYPAQIKSVGNKKLGLYHFADVSASVSQQGDKFLNSFKPYTKRAVPVLDWEGEAISLGVNWAKAWLDYVAAKTGVNPLIYMSKATARAFDWSPVSNKYGLWFAQYGSYNPMGWVNDPWTDNGNTGAWKSPAMFQYTSTGRIAGYNGNLDLSLFYGDSKAWDKYAGSNGSPAPRPQPTPKTVSKSAIQQFKDAGNRFTAYGSFKLDQVKFVNGIWQGISYWLAGGRDANWTLNGIPLEVLDNRSGDPNNTKAGDVMIFNRAWNHGTIDEYDPKSNGVGIRFGVYGMIWFNANALLKL